MEELPRSKQSQELAPNLVEQIERSGSELPGHVDLTLLRQVTSAPDESARKTDTSSSSSNAISLGIMASMPQGIFRLPTVPEGQSAQEQSGRVIDAVLKSLSRK